MAYYQTGYVDPKVIFRNPDQIPGGAPPYYREHHSYPNVLRPVQVSADALDRPEGPQAPSMEDYRQAYVPYEGTTEDYRQAYVPYEDTTENDGQAHLPYEDTTQDDRQAHLPYEDTTQDDGQAHLPYEDTTEDDGQACVQYDGTTVADYTSPTTIDSSEEPPAQHGTVEGGLLLHADWYNLPAIDSSEEPPAQPGTMEGGLFQPTDWYNLPAIDSSEEPPAQPGTMEGGISLSADSYNLPAIDSSAEPPTEIGSLVDFYVSDPPAEWFHLPAFAFPAAPPAQPGPWADPSSSTAIDSLREPPAQPGNMATAWESDLPVRWSGPTAIGSLREPPAQPGNMATAWESDLRVYWPGPTAVDSLAADPPAPLGVVAEASVPRANGAVEEPPAQLGTMADGWVADLPAEGAFNGLEAITAYSIDGDYHAKVIFVLENPEAKLSVEDVPVGKGTPASFKFSAKRDYELGIWSDGSKFIYRRIGEGAAAKQKIARRDHIWRILCQGHKDAATGRHCGRDKTKEVVEDRLCYHGITKKMIDNFLDACPVCAPQRLQKRAQIQARKRGLATGGEESPSKRARTV